MSDPVVEELRDKGVNALDRLAAKGYVLDDYEHGEIVELVLDAVFPGWREGKLQFGLLAPNGNVHGPISNRVTAESAAFTNDRLVSRWVGPWVPVEEGTDG